MNLKAEDLWFSTLYVDVVISAYVKCVWPDISQDITGWKVYYIMGCIDPEMETLSEKTEFHEFGICVFPWLGLY